MKRELGIESHAWLYYSVLETWIDPQTKGLMGRLIDALFFVFHRDPPQVYDLNLIGSSDHTSFLPTITYGGPIPLKLLSPIGKRQLQKAALVVIEQLKDDKIFAALMET